MSNAVKRLLQDRPIAYHPDVARVCGSVKAGVFFSQLLYWSDKGKRGDGFIWKTQGDWEEETALTRYEQEGARKALKERGFIDEQLTGVPAKLHYRVNFDIFLNALEKHYAESDPHSSMGKNHILDWGKPPNRNGENPQTITESTKENIIELDADFSKVVKAYENDIGVIGKTISDNLQDALYSFPADWIVDAIGEAARYNAKNWKYISAVLNNWQAKGRGSNTGKNGSTTPAARIATDETGGYHV